MAPITTLSANGHVNHTSQLCMLMRHCFIISLLCEHGRNG